MAYAPTTWVDGVTPVNAANLNKLEIGLQNAVGIPADVAVPAASFLIRNKLLVADAQPAFRINGDGKMEWGVGGATAPSTNLYMENGTLVTDDNLWARGFVGSEGAIYREATNATDIGMEFYLRVWPGADHFKMLVNGQMQWGPGTSPLDVTLRRFGVTTLALDGSLLVFPPPADGGGGQILLDVASGWAYPVLQGVGTGIAFTAGGTNSQGSWDVYTASDVEGISFFRNNAGTGPTGDLFRFTQGGLKFSAGGALTGAAATAGFDTSIFRLAANILQTPGQMHFASVITHPTGGEVGWHSNPASGANYMLYHRVQAEAYPRFTIDGGGSLSWGSGSANTDITLQRVGAGSLFTQANLTLGTVIPTDMYVGSGRFFISAAGVHEWGPGDWSRDTNLYRVQPGILGTDGQIYLRGAASYIAIYRSTDANARFYIGPDGNHNWGPGNVTQDTSLYRSGVASLYTDGNFAAGGYLIANANIAATQIVLAADGRIYFGTANDTSLYRIAANHLGTAGILSITGYATVNNATATQIWLHPDGGIYFSNLADTVLKRVGPGYLQTDGHFKVVGNLMGGGRVGEVAKSCADWNLANENGWWMAADALNAPGASWFIGEVVAHNALYITQRLWKFTDPAGSPVYERRMFGGTWGAWVTTSAVDLVYEGAHVPATAYTDGDIVVYNGQAYICVRPTTAAPTWNTVPGPPIGTTLPASPVDGQEFTLVDSLTAPTYSWRFRYVAGITDAYKWIFVGGGTLYAEDSAYVTTGSMTYVALTGGPNITLPRAGIYDIGLGGMITQSSGPIVFMSYDIGATGAVDADALKTIPALNANDAVWRTKRKTFAAAATLSTKYRVDRAAAMAAENRRIQAVPIRVA